MMPPPTSSSVHRMPSNVPSVQTVTRDPLPRSISDVKEDIIRDGNDHDQFPEGGTAAWCAVIGGAIVQFCAFGYTTSFGVYQAYYTLYYLTDESTSAISWIGSVNGFLVCVTSLVSSMLYDRGYFYHLLVGGSILQSFSLFMLSFAQPGQWYQIFLAQGIGLGLAQGLVYIPATVVVSHYFQKHRTLAMSLVASGTSLGSVVHPIMLNYLFNRDIGFANGVRISATLISVCLLIGCLIIRTRLGPPQYPANYLSVGRGVIKDVPFCIMGLGTLIFEITFYFPIVYFQLDSVKHGNSETFSFYSLVLLNVGSLIGRLSSGFIAIHVGLARLIIISTAASGILILGMIGLSDVPTVVVIGTLCGYFTGVYGALAVPLIALLTSDFSELGARTGIGLMFMSIGVLLSGPISGALLTSQYKWWQPSLFNGLAALVACSLLIAMEVLRLRRCATEKRTIEV